MSDPSVVGAAQGLLHQLRFNFPSVPSDVIQAVIAQHSFDPVRCFELVRLRAQQLSSGQGDGRTSGDSVSSETANNGLYHSSESMPNRPRGSYVIRRSHSPVNPMHCGNASGRQFGQILIETGGGEPNPEEVNRSQRSWSTSYFGGDRSPSASRRSASPFAPLPADEISRPKTPIVVQRSFPALKIDLQPVTQRIVFSGPSSPSVVVQSPSTSSFLESNSASRRVSRDNNAENSNTTTTSSAHQTASPYERYASNNHASSGNVSPSIRIRLDQKGGTVFTNSNVRMRPRVTFSPLTTFQRLPANASGITVSFRPPAQHSATYGLQTPLPQPPPVVEYLNSLLIHQAKRRDVMKQALETSQSRLLELRMDVEAMERDMTSRRKHSVRSAKISEDEVSKLHEETRVLQAEIQTMLRELELRRSGQVPVVKRNASDVQVAIKNKLLGGYDERDAFTEALVQESAANDNFSFNVQNKENVWSCILCNFTNHHADGVCKSCDMPKVLETANVTTNGDLQHSVC